jgi:hypothetical protein
VLDAATLPLVLLWRGVSMTSDSRITLRFRVPRSAMHAWVALLDATRLGCVLAVIVAATTGGAAAAAGFAANAAGHAAYTLGRLSFIVPLYFQHGETGLDGGFGSAAAHSLLFWVEAALLMLATAVVSGPALLRAGALGALWWP